MMTKLEVRCCCDPGLLLGWLKVPTDRVFIGSRVAWMVREPFNPLLSPDDPIVAEKVELEVARIETHYPVTKSWLALKSNDTPIETLMKLPGFEKGPDAELPVIHVTQGEDGMDDLYASAE